jgi:hypothetical protein
VLWLGCCLPHADDTLWTGAPGSYTDPDAPAALAAVRELVDQGRFADATAAATRLFGGQSEVTYIQITEARTAFSCFLFLSPRLLFRISAAIHSKIYKIPCLPVGSEFFFSITQISRILKYVQPK